MSNLCPQCGSGNRELARFCAECGAGLARIDRAAANEVRAALLAIEGAGAGIDGADAEIPAGEAGQPPAGDPLPPAAEALATSDARDEYTAGDEDTAGDEGTAGSEATAGDLLLAGQYRVLASATDEAGRQVLTAEDRGVCRACGAVLDPLDAEEPFCTNCGAHWQRLAAPWPVCRLVEDSAPANEAQQVTWAGRTFVVVAGPTTPDDVSGAGAAGGAFLRPPCLLAGQRSDVGAARTGRSNEDSLYALTATMASATLAVPTLGLYVVADGMGGHLDGEVASRTACAVVGESLLQALAFPALAAATLEPAAVEAAIAAAIQAANRSVVDLAAANDSNMGTTLVLALVLDAQVYLANVGDSRAYLWGRDGLRQVTADHSHVFKLLASGVITEEEIYSHPRRNEIYRSLGTAVSVEIDTFQELLQPGDVLLLCSDGLWEMLRNEGIADVLALNLGDPQVICDELVRRANLAGGEDNISVIAVRAAG